MKLPQLCNFSDNNGCNAPIARRTQYWRADPARATSHNTVSQCLTWFLFPFHIFLQLFFNVVVEAWLGAIQAPRRLVGLRSAFICPKVCFFLTVPLIKKEHVAVNVREWYHRAAELSKDVSKDVPEAQLASVDGRAVVAGTPRKSFDILPHLSHPIDIPRTICGIPPGFVDRMWVWNYPDPCGCSLPGCFHI